MTTLLTIALLLCSLFLIALSHELGHWVCARFFGVAVPRIQLGVGPHVIKGQWLGTTWRLGLLPLGGWTRVHGMDPRDVYRITLGDYRRCLPFERTLIVLGGVLGNVVLACAVHALLVAASGAGVWDTLVAAAHAPVQIAHAVVGMWAHALHIPMDAPPPPLLQVDLASWLRTTAAGSLLVGLLNLVPTPLTDGGRLLRMAMGRAR